MIYKSQGYRQLGESVLCSVHRLKGWKCLRRHWVGFPPGFGLFVDLHVAQLHTMVDVHVPLSVKPLSVN